MLVVKEVSTRGSSAAFPIAVYIPCAGWNRTALQIALLNLLPLLPHTTSPPQKRWCIKQGGGIRRNPPLVHARRMRQFQLPWIYRLILTALLSPSSYEDEARKEIFLLSETARLCFCAAGGMVVGRAFSAEDISSDLNKTSKKTPKCQIQPLQQKPKSWERATLEKL